ncbi:hypothetical protein MnTg01_00004 [archaeon MnTg01]|nr:hypothetical protein MnTg01_00004 [archaeon MnTg01]
MNQTIKNLGLLAILPLVMVALSADLIDQADAQKAEGSPGHVSPKSYGSATADIVCGGVLCSTPQGEPDPINVGRAS